MLVVVKERKKELFFLLWVLCSCGCLITKRKKNIFNNSEHWTLSHPPPTPSIPSHLTSSACVWYHHGNRHKRERERETRRMIRWGSHANFAMLFKELVSKRSAFRTWAIHFICSEQLGNEYHSWSPRQHCCPFFTGTLDIRHNLCS